MTVGFVGKMKDQYIPEGVPFLRGQNVRPNRYDPEGLCYVSEGFHHQLAKSALAPNDVLIVRSGSVGTACVVPAHLPRSNCSDLVIVKQPKGIDPLFGAYFMNSMAQRAVRDQQVGIALTHFNTKSAAELSVPVPPVGEQERIVESTQKQLSAIEKTEGEVSSQLARCTRLRQSILKWAFEGKLVDQDPNDEPASALLERIRAERGAAATRPSPKRPQRPAPPSPEVLAARAPRPPEELVGALHDRIHPASGRLLRALPIRRIRSK